MMIFDGNQVELMKLRASVLLNAIQEKEQRKYERNWLVQDIVEAFQEMCSMGYSVAQYELRSTPWEWRTLFVPAGAHRNEACEQAMNAYSEAGWELYMVTIDRQFWRRRRAVRELEAKSI